MKAETGEVAFADIGEEEEEDAEEGDSELGSSIELLGSYHEADLLMIDHHGHYVTTSPFNPTRSDVVCDPTSALERVDNNFRMAKLATTTTTAGATDVFCFDIDPTLEKGEKEKFTTSTGEVNGDDGSPPNMTTNARAPQSLKEGDQPNNSEIQLFTTAHTTDKVTTAISSIEKTMALYSGLRDKLLLISLAISLAIIAAQGVILLSYKYQQQGSRSVTEELGPLSGVEQNGRAGLPISTTTYDGYEHNRELGVDEDTVFEPPLPPSGEPPSSASTKNAAFQRYSTCHKEVPLALEMMQDEVKSIEKEEEVNGDGPSSPIKDNKRINPFDFYSIVFNICMLLLFAVSLIFVSLPFIECVWPRRRVEGSNKAEQVEQKGNAKVLTSKEVQLHAEALVQLQLDTGRKEMEKWLDNLFDWLDSGESPPPGTAGLYTIYKNRTNHALRLFDSWQKDSREACDISHMAALRSKLVDELYGSYENTRLEANLELQTDVANKRQHMENALVESHSWSILVGAVIGILVGVSLDYLLYFYCKPRIDEGYPNSIYAHKYASWSLVAGSQLVGILIVSAIRLPNGLKKKEKDYPKLDFFPPGSKVELVETHGEGESIGIRKVVLPKKINDHGD